MKIIVVILLLAMPIHMAFGQCGAAKILPSDKTYGDVNQRLACLAGENDSLKEQLAKAKSQIAVLREAPPLPVHMTLRGFGFSPNVPSVDACRLRATNTAQNLSAVNISPMQLGLDFHVRDMIVVISCATLPQGLVVIAGTDPASIQKLSSEILQDFMP